MFAIKRLLARRITLRCISSSNIVVEEKRGVNEMDQLLKVISESSPVPEIPRRVIYGHCRTEV